MFGSVPPDIDVYVLVSDRSRESIDKFLNSYIDTEKSNHRGDQESDVVPIGYEGDIENLEDWDSISTQSLEEIVSLGLSYPRRAFTVHLKTKAPEHDMAVLTFTRDDRLVFGLSIDDGMNDPENAERARDLAVQLLNEFDGVRSWFVGEYPPPLDDVTFERQRPYLMGIIEQDGI